MRQYIILLCAVHYNYNALRGVVHEICSTAHSFDLRGESITLHVVIRTLCMIFGLFDPNFVHMYLLNLGWEETIDDQTEGDGSTGG